MAINTQNFSSMVQSMVSTVQGRAVSLVDLTVGSVLRALTEAFAAQLLWLQAQLLSVLASSRASTSSGTDLDSWMADYAFTRLPATCATGYVTLSRYTASSPATVAVGGTISAGIVSGTAVLQTQDGTLQFVILADDPASNPDFNATLNAYVISGGTASIDVRVGCLTPGMAGNVAATVINTLAAALPGVDSASNALPFTDALDAETDSAFRSRFIAWLASLSKATQTAMLEAAESVQNGVSCSFQENIDYTSGLSRLGYFYVVADDGSGAPGPAFISSVSNAVDAVRPLAVQFEVWPPQLLSAAVQMQLTLQSGYDSGGAVSDVSTALQAYIQTLPLGAGLAYSKLAQIAWDATPGLSNVSLIKLNGGSDDIAGNSKVAVRPWLLAVSSAAVAVGGSGYVVNDVLTPVGGTATTAAQLTVSGVDGSGAVTAVSVQTVGAYSALPASPAGVSGGTGSGAQFTLVSEQLSTIEVVVFPATPS